MLKGISAILIWSEDYKKFSDWYVGTLGLKVIEEINHPEDTGVGMMVGPNYLWIGQHSKVKGISKEPDRIMLNLLVDSVTESYNQLKSKNVEFITNPFKAPTFDKWFATFRDLDGNTLQLYGEK